LRPHRCFATLDAGRDLWRVRKFSRVQPATDGKDKEVQDILNTTGHRPTPLPKRHWAATQRWNDLLFAHWPVPPVSVASLLPAGLVPDTFDGSAWIGVVPFWMDRIRFSGLPRIPGASSFPELNLRTYVREEHTNLAGVYFFSLDAANPIAVTVARTFFRLPYYWAHMAIKPQQDGRFFYRSDRHLTRKPVRFRATYRGLGPTHRLAQSVPGTIEYFLTERYRLYTAAATSSRAISTISPGRSKPPRRSSTSMSCRPPTASRCRIRSRSSSTRASWWSTFGRSSWPRVSSPH
jgi:hypothetical protein